MKKVIAFAVAFALILALAVSACAEDFEQNPRAELDGDTLRLTCGPELLISETVDYSARQTFRVAKNLARWESGPATVELRMVDVETYTLKKISSYIRWDWLSGFNEGDTFTVIALSWTVTCPEGDTVWINPSTALLRLPGGEPLPTFRYLSLSAEFSKVDGNNRAQFYTSFATKDIAPADVAAFDFSMPMPFGEDLRPFSDPLLLHVELLHEP